MDLGGGFEGFLLSAKLRSHIVVVVVVGAALAIRVLEEEEEEKAIPGVLRVPGDRATCAKALESIF